MSGQIIDIGHHSRVPVTMRGKLRPRASEIFTSLLAMCSPRKPQIWIDQGKIAHEQGIHRENVGKWVRYLVNSEYLIFLGYHRDGRRKRYEVNFAKMLEPSPKKQSKTANKKSTSLEKKSFVPDNENVGRPEITSLDDTQRFRCTNNRIERTDIKEQTTVVVPPPPKKEFSSNEKIALKQKLKAIGVHKHVIDRLISKHSMEKINAQIEHLQHVTERVGNIEKPAAWLIAAIEKNYEPPKEIKKNSLEEEKKASDVTKATVLAQKAKAELMEGNLKEALDLSTKSTLLAQNTLAKEVHHEAEQMLQKAQKIEEARQKVSAEKLQLIRQEEEQKQLQTMRRFLRRSEAQIRDNPLFKGAVEALINQRLLAVV